MEDVRGEPSWIGKIVRSILGRSREKLLKPYGIATDGAGRIYAADTAKRMIYRFDLEKRQIYRYEEFQPCGGGNRKNRRSFVSRLLSGQEEMALLSPIGVAMDRSGNLYVADSVRRRVYVFDEKGQCLREIGSDEELERPSGIAISRKTGRLYVTDTAGHKIVVYDTDGSRVFEFGRRGDKPGEFNFPTNIFVDTNDRIYVMDSLNFRVEVFTSEGELLSYFGQLGKVSGTFNKPKGIAVDSEGHIYVVDALFDAVQIFDGSGRLLLAFGESGAGEGEFWLPSGIHIDEKDTIYVSDSYNTRVQIFQYLKQHPVGEP